MRFLFGWLVLATGCGGAIDTSLLDAGADAHADAAAEAAVDAGSGSCDTLLAAVSKQAAAVAQCCDQCNVMQCDRLVEGVCCPLVVNQNAAVGPYLDAVAAFRAAQCQAVCPALVCPDTPSDMCTSGTCVQ